VFCVILRTQYSGSANIKILESLETCAFIGVLTVRRDVRQGGSLLLNNTLSQAAYTPSSCSSSSVKSPMCWRVRLVSVLHGVPWQRNIGVSRSPFLS
jgi:hypothetical protein